VERQPDAVLQYPPLTVEEQLLAELQLLIRTVEPNPMSSIIIELPPPSITVMVPVLSIFDSVPALSRSKPKKKLPGSIWLNAIRENWTLGISIPDEYIG
jgi:hypothetical protein